MSKVLVCLLRLTILYPALHSKHVSISSLAANGDFQNIESMVGFGGDHIQGSASNIPLLGPEFAIFLYTGGSSDNRHVSHA